MNTDTSRRGFIRGLAGAGFLGAAGGCMTCGEKGKIKLAVVGVGGKGYTDWTTMLATGMAEVVAFCDADAAIYRECIQRAKTDGFGDLSAIPFYTDYRKLLKDCGLLGVRAMTVSTPDHAHAAIAVQAMKQGIHVYVQKPLVRTLWELKYFEETAKKHRVIVQMGNQGSSLTSMRRCTEVLQSGILGDVREVHVWTNRAVWPQGYGVRDYVNGRGADGDPVRPGLDWNSWLGVARERPFLDRYPDGTKVYDPWNIGKNVYHKFTWRGFLDFGAGAFGDMACHTMNLPFRGLELADVTEAECVQVSERNDLAFPAKSIVKLVYRERDSKVRPGVKLPAVTLFWYDGYDETKPGKSANKPASELMPKWTREHGEVPNTGCLVIGSAGQVLMQDDYGGKCAIALTDDEKFTDVFEHPVAKSVAHTIPYCDDGVAAVGPSSVEMKGLGDEHCAEFLRAIRGEGPVYEQTNSRCFSDIAYCVPQMEGILVGVVAQQVPGRHVWDTRTQRFGDDAANRLLKPYIRKGWEF